MYQAALFDLDGVVVNTEAQYTVFWGRVGKRYFPSHPHFADEIKGSTLVQIYDKYFSNQVETQSVITAALNDFESAMTYDYVPGITTFVSKLKTAGVKTAVVTSSNMQKMENVYKVHPEFKDFFDVILTSEDFERSKPDPDCYLKATERFGLQPNQCVGFEDSINGLKAVRRAGLYCVGLATTNSEEVVAKYADIVVRDYLLSENKTAQERYNKMSSLFVL